MPDGSDVITPIVPVLVARRLEGRPALEGALRRRRLRERRDLPRRPARRRAAAHERHGDARAGPPRPRPRDLRARQGRGRGGRSRPSERPRRDGPPRGAARLHASVPFGGPLSPTGRAGIHGASHQVLTGLRGVHALETEAEHQTLVRHRDRGVLEGSSDWIQSLTFSDGPSGCGPGTAQPPRSPCVSNEVSLTVEPRGDRRVVDHRAGHRRRAPVGREHDRQLDLLARVGAQVDRPVLPAARVPARRVPRAGRAGRQAIVVVIARAVLDQRLVVLQDRVELRPARRAARAGVVARVPVGVRQRRVVVLALPS